MEKDKREKPKRYGATWTKNITRYLLIIGVVNGTLPFVLSAFGRDPVSDMGIAWVTEIVAVALAYFVRGFKDTKAEQDMKFKRDRLEMLSGDDAGEETDTGGKG